MYELVSVMFPFADNRDKAKPRPGFVISPPFGIYNQVVVAYVTTQLDEILESDIVLDPEKSYFTTTGLLHKSVVKLHRLSTFQANMLKEGQGILPKKTIIELQRKLKKIFQLP